MHKTKVHAQVDMGLGGCHKGPYWVQGLNPRGGQGSKAPVEASGIWCKVHHKIKEYIHFLAHHI
jgi:hypothetical protein